MKKNQVLKYQFPSSFSTGRNIDVAARFKIHPFVFMLRLLADDRIGSLSEEELAKIMRGEGYTSAFKPVDGLKEFLLGLKKKNVKISVSSCRLYETGAIVEKR